jgi:hypothetical protein
MAKHYQVLRFLIPNGGYVQSGETYEGIDFIDCEPITKKQYEDGFAQYDAWAAQQETEKETIKAELLARLGITSEELATLLA